MEWVETTGRTIDEAKDIALDRLGVHEDDAEFEIIGDVKTGLFGRVKENARVRARVRPTAPRAKEERRGRQRDRGGKGRGRKNGNKKQQSGKQQSDKQRSGDRAAKKEPTTGSGHGRDGEDGRANENQAGRRGTKKKQSGGEGRSGENRRNKEKSVNDEPTMTLAEQADLAEEFVVGLADLFSVETSVERTEIDDEEIRLTVNGDDLGRLIGRRGTTAAAIDELVRTVLQRQAGSSRNGRVRVDVGGVRAKRAEALAEFCRERAAEVRESGDRLVLEPMGAADRKVIHDTIATEDDVDTVSEGEDPNRRVVIVPAGDGD